MARDDDSRTPSSVSKSKSRSPPSPRAPRRPTKDDDKSASPEPQPQPLAAQEGPQLVKKQEALVEKTLLSFSLRSRGRAENQPSGNPTRAFGGAARLYVGNLPYEMTTEQLADTFKSCGTIVDSIVKNGRENGSEPRLRRVVEFSDPKEGGEGHRRVPQQEHREWGRKAVGRPVRPRV